MNGMFMLFIVVFGGIFLLALVIAVRSEVRLGGKLPKKATQGNYQKIGKARVNVRGTNDHHKNSQTIGARSKQTIDQVMKREHSDQI